MGAKALGSTRMQEILKKYLRCNVYSIDGADISYALDEQWEDFEDCLIWRAAKKIRQTISSQEMWQILPARYTSAYTW